MSAILPIILSGGSGTRLWPLSRAVRPKQFLSLTGDLSLFQQTVHRLSGLTEEEPIIVANDEHRFLVAEQCREIGVSPKAILLESVSRNTAPAICTAALKGVESGDDPVLLVLPSDHVFDSVDELHTAFRAGLLAAESGKLVTFGISPVSPETGYGYIQTPKASEVESSWVPVLRFVEKPDKQSAERYLREGGFYWNSGMFMFRASAVLDELRSHIPAIYRACEEALREAKSDLDFIRLGCSAFTCCPSDSIDYAVMEKTRHAAMVPLRTGWSDLGAWSAVWAVSPKDASGNAAKGDVISKESRNCYIHSDHRLVAAHGVEDLVIVETADAVFVGKKDKCQDVKSIVESLKREGRTEVTTHREVQRPWGSYDSIGAGPRYQVKRITVKPGAKLSVQMHHHRAEHWVVVRGTARVRIGDLEKLVTENESVYIPIGDVHSLENPGKVPLELIEVQSGVYLGEDDIVRFEDRYGRA